MISPDGPEERTAFYQKSYERDLDQLDIEEQLADESHDDLAFEDLTWPAGPDDPLLTLALQRMAMEDAQIERILDGSEHT